MFQIIHPILLSTGGGTDSIPALPIAEAAKDLATGNVHWDKVMSQLVTWGLDAGRHILVAAVLYLVGHYLIRLLTYLLNRFMERRKIEISVKTFVESFVGIVLQVLLIVSVVSALGVNTTSFAALLASFGVAVGMALSGNLQNFAGGIVILFLKPYKVGDWIEAQGVAGTVESIQIFHTVLKAVDGKQVHVPNGPLSSGNITNYTRPEMRMVEWVVSVEYGTDISQAREVVLSLLSSDSRVMATPPPVVWLKELNTSSVDLLIRCWASNADYWGVSFETREKIYNAFNAAGIGFPFPQLTIHHGGGENRD